MQAESVERHRIAGRCCRRCLSVHRGEGSLPVGSAGATGAGGTAAPRAARAKY
ncbi:hypothetical protein RSPO_c01220 [Ralstonia solanacearum Po82]|uniref:Uncharacterized protein n=1 Tax=Ralstonia solanacearum (strain Po82) TaxID=1031711 RepID=F6FZF2_RALS8|nr:hypothetical protein RSPO_c01220 [Ralstonia solanacearum Po82]